jgi:RND family efflux transporter MFP subunit
MKLKRKHVVPFAACVLILVCAWLVFSTRPGKDTHPQAATLQPVAVALVQRRPISSSLTLSGEFRPFQEVDVHAKVAGYIRKIYVDVGDHVKAGQTLAMLEVPELSAQVLGADAAVRRAKDAISRAKGDLRRAESLHEATRLDYERLKQASAERPGLIAQQELDDAMAKDKEGEAQISADEAALSESQNQLDESQAQQKQYAAMSDYTRIVAPFTGVITKRYVDTGALVQAGTNSNTQALPVVSVAEADLFRLTLPVPEPAVPSVRLGSTVNVHVTSLNRDFEGKVARFADDLNLETRTMHTEVDVPNKDGTIVAGMYAEVNLTLNKKEGALVVPIQAVARNGQQATVLVVNAKDRIEERKIELGLEGADQVEVVSGLNSNDRVIIGSRSQYRVGDAVAPKVIAQSEEGNF